MGILFIDAGNTNIKWRLSDSPQIYCCSAETSELAHWLSAYRQDINAVAISSVRTGNWDQSIRKLCKRVDLDCWFASSMSQNLGLNVAYANPANLGVDRWLAMLALWDKFDSGFLVVDAGTAITIDLVDNSGTHQGGYILPGLSMQRQSLLGKSAVLDNQVDKLLPPSTKLGTDTDEAIENGILASVLALIQDLITKQSSWLNSIVLTGGDAQVLKPFINTSQVEESLVLEGLALAYSQNKQQQEKGN